MMVKTTMSAKFLPVAGFLVSFFAFFWLALLPIGSYSILWRLGFVAAALCAMGSITFCWAALAAFLAREWNWSPRTCMRAGWPFIPLALIAGVAGSQFWRAAGLLATNSLFAGLLCRRFVYPEMTDEQAAAPEPPLSLFPKKSREPPVFPL